jgi:ABC-type transport system involved in multi-copper enzyme maturation permease subunit
VIVLAVPLLVAFFFVAGYASLGEAPPPFSEAEVRARILSEGWLDGVPPEEAEVIIIESIAAEREQHGLTVATYELVRSRYAFPQSLVTVLGNGMLVFFAVILLTATTIGDEFGWATIRTALLAASNRRRMLLVRMAALATAAVSVVAMLVVLGIILPAILSLTGAQLPSTPVDGGAVLALIAALILVSLAVMSFAALATVLVRSGSLTLVAALVYLVVETAILALLLRFETFQQNGSLAWVLDAFPVRGVVTLSDTISRAASGLAHYPGEPVIRDLGPAGLPAVALLAWGALFAALSFRRFMRMDIVE